MREKEAPGADRDGKNSDGVRERPAVPEAREPVAELGRQHPEFAAHQLEVVLIHPVGRDRAGGIGFIVGRRDRDQNGAQEARNDDGDAPVPDRRARTG